MKCSGCGAHLPLRSYGEVRCDYCQTLNYIPVPGETDEVAEKAGAQKKPVKKEEIQKPKKSIEPLVEKESPSKGFPKALLIVVILIIGAVSAYTILGSNSGSSSKTYAYSTPKPTYSTPSPTSSYKTPTTTSTPTKTPAPKETIIIEETPIPKQIEGGTEKMTENPVAVILTNKGEFKFELYAKRAPTTVANFIELAESEFYNGLTFHRYEPGFVIQGGDPLGTGMGGSDKKIQLEIHQELRHVEGAVAMARSQDPNSASCQFYVTLAPAHFLDDNYAVFGQITEGMDVVLSLRRGDKMEKVTIEK